MMTEEEARQKWCPMAKAMNVSMDGEAYSASFNRVAELSDSGFISHINQNPQACRCIASDCMLWEPMRQGSADSDVNAVTLLRFGGCGLSAKVVVMK